MGRKQDRGDFAMKVSGNTVHLTPRWLLRQLGNFDLDPCASEDQPYKTARKMLTEKDDGLKAKWKGLVFCNPPYGTTNGEREFLMRMAEHNNGVLLFLCKTGTKMWRDFVWPVAKGILFLDGRVIFNKPDGTSSKGYAAIDTVLVAYGHEAFERLKNSKLSGTLIDLSNRQIMSDVQVRGRMD